MAPFMSKLKKVIVNRGTDEERLARHHAPSEHLRGYFNLVTEPFQFIANPFDAILQETEDAGVAIYQQLNARQALRVRSSRMELQTAFKLEAQIEILDRNLKLFERMITKALAVLKNMSDLVDSVDFRQNSLLDVRTVMRSLHRVDIEYRSQWHEAFLHPAIVGPITEVYHAFLEEMHFRVIEHEELHAAGTPVPELFANGIVILRRINVDKERLAATAERYTSQALKFIDDRRFYVEVISRKLLEAVNRSGRDDMSAWMSGLSEMLRAALKNYDYLHEEDYCLIKDGHYPLRRKEQQATEYSSLVERIRRIKLFFENELPVSASKELLSMYKEPFLIGLMMIVGGITFGPFSTLARVARTTQPARFRLFPSSTPKRLAIKEWKMLYHALEKELESVQLSSKRWWGNTGPTNMFFLGIPRALMAVLDERIERPSPQARREAIRWSLWKPLPPLPQFQAGTLTSRNGEESSAKARPLGGTYINPDGRPSLPANTTSTDAQLPIRRQYSSFVRSRSMTWSELGQTADRRFPAEAWEFGSRIPSISPSSSTSFQSNPFPGDDPTLDAGNEGPPTSRKSHPSLPTPLAYFTTEQGGSSSEPSPVTTLSSEEGELFETPRRTRFLASLERPVKGLVTSSTPSLVGKVVGGGRKRSATF